MQGECTNWVGGVIGLGITSKQVQSFALVTRWSLVAARLIPLLSQ